MYRLGRNPSFDRNPGSGPTLLQAGTEINDALYSTTQIAAAGGILVPSTDAAAAAAALIAQKRQKQGEGDASSATLLDLIMLAAVAGEANSSSASRKSSSAAAGATVAAGAAIVPAISFTPTFSGKVLVRAWMSAEALATGTFTPVLKEGSTTIVAPAQYTGSADAVPANVYIEQEVDGLTVGTAVTFNLTTTAGDATVTLGNGSTGIAARMTVQELP
jgi:hypothetical protein